MRFLSRLDWKLPRGAGLKALVLLFGATAIAGIVAGGHGRSVASAVTAWAGFGIQKVEITGQSETSEVNVLDALDLDTYPSLLTLDVDAARARVEDLPWVKSATLKKLFPDTLEIAIAERSPYAIWQLHGELVLIDNSGRVISHTVDERYAGLPRVVGEGAGDRAAAFEALIARFPDIASRTRAGVLVSERRWNVILDDGITLMLPAGDPEGALATVEKLDRAKSLLSRQIAAVDLRDDGKLIVRLTDEGVAAHLATLKERARALRAGRAI